MGEINICAELEKDNPKARLIDIELFAAALQTYQEAALNVAQNGAICTHPRTGAPIENPYLKIRNQQTMVIKKMANIKSDRVLKMIKSELLDIG